MERDELLYEIKKTALIAVFSDDLLMEQLVLKGGNALDLVYHIAVRSSLDLDFSCAGELAGADDLQSRLDRRLSEAFAERRLRVFDLRVEEVPPELTDDIRDFWGGYRVQFKLANLDDAWPNQEALRRNALVVGRNNSTKFSFEISKHELTEGKRAVQFDGYSIYVYSPVMIACEKLRAICQQMIEYAPVVMRTRPGAPRARDFLDFWIVCNRFDLDFSGPPIQAVARETFAAKRVPLFLLGRLPAQREFHRQNYVAVQDTVAADFPLRDFDFYFDFLLAKIAPLHAVWVEDAPA